MIRAALCLLLAAGCVRGAGAAVPVEVAVDCKKPGHRISPLIYGVGFSELPSREQALPWELGATARRWGGNSSSRYNWKLGSAWNTAADWFFRNVSYGRRGPAYAQFIEENREHGIASVLSVPIIGWVAKDTFSVSFPVSRFGPQRAIDPDTRKAGDGFSPEGKPLPPEPPERTSVAAPPEFIAEWVRTMSAERPRMYILDNEPMLWDETHRDVHPQPTTYDELLDRTLRYGAAVRRADPNAVIAGPALWGWPAYFFSAADKRAGFSRHPDRSAHGGVPLLPWLLQQLRAHEQKTGEHILDVVDVHFYPQADGIGGAHGRTDAKSAAQRLRSVRGLWDPSYRDESYIGEAIRLLPRVREWIDENDPGLGISIGEYNFGAERDLSSGLAVAEALGRFAEAGITSAFYWTSPPRGSPPFWAFRAFRDFDGKGAAFESVFAGVTTADRLSVFASRDERAGRVVLVAVNGREEAAPLALRLDRCGAQLSSRRFVYRGDSLVQQDGEDLPPQSIAVVELQFSHER